MKEGFTNGSNMRILINFLPLTWSLSNVNAAMIAKKTENAVSRNANTKLFLSKTYKALQNTENALWAESAGYIADRYFDEQHENNHV